MKILWMTSLRPIGKSKENDNIQELFIKSVTNLKSEVKFSFTQFDDNGVEDYIKSNNLITCSTSSINLKSVFLNLISKGLLILFLPSLGGTKIIIYFPLY